MILLPLSEQSGCEERLAEMLQVVKHNTTKKKKKNHSSLPLTESSSVKFKRAGRVRGRGSVWQPLHKPEHTRLHNVK